MGKILGADGRPYETTEQSLRRQLAESQRRYRGAMSKVDAAATTDENSRHWGRADSLGPNAAMDSAVRQKCRDRARYETLNNSYCKGMVNTQSDDFAGTGPRLQLSIPDESGEPNETTRRAAKKIEHYYAKWARAVRFGHVCRMLEKCRLRDGGGFAMFDTYMPLKDPVKLFLRMAEDEEVCTPWEKIGDSRIVDGVELDGFRQPVAYWFTARHPGESTSWTAAKQDYFRLEADRVIHWYDQDRIGQVRGIPEITPALPLFAHSRRLALATVVAAEVAAMLAGVMETQSGFPTSAEPQQPAAFEIFDMVRGSLLTLPEGRTAHQFKPEQPTTTYGDFNRELLNEAGRSTGAPQNVVTGNSSGYNFSSARMDFVPYHRHLWIKRDDFRDVASDRVFVSYVVEAKAIWRELYAPLPPVEDWSWTWNWDGFDSIDPLKDAEADAKRLETGTATLKEILASYGQDFDEQLEQLAREVKAFAAHGLVHPFAAAVAPMVQKNDGTRIEPEDEEEDDEEEDQDIAANHRLNGFSKNGRH